MADHDDLKNPEPHAAPDKTLTDQIIEAALSLGGGAVTLLSGLLAAVLILYSGYVLYDTFATERAASSNAWELLQFKPEILEDPESFLNPDTLADINEDYRAWLTVYDTNIDYPVMQGPNDYYYAYHDIYQESSLTGSIYLAAGNSRDFSDTYNVIYGHHMDNGAMFGGLDKMTGSETGVIVSGNKIYNVQFFAVVTTDAYEHEIYDVGNRMNSVLDFLRSGGEGGVGVGTNVVYFNEDAAEDAVKLVALSTCANANTNGRLVVIGKMDEHIVMKDVTVKKIWNDNNNQDGIRPVSLKVTASDGTETVLNESNGWEAVVSLPKYDNAGEITYTWTEEHVEGYQLTDNDTKGDVTTLTNTHEPATQSLTVRKEWVDDTNRDGLRPDKVTAILSNGIRVVLEEKNGWKATVAGLYVYENGQRINYTWTEEDIEGYTLTGNETQDLDTLLTNTHTVETTTLGVKKIWVDGDNQDGIRPDSVTVTLYGNDTALRTVTLDESSGWTASVDGLYVNENGEPIEYRWEEESIDGYELTDVREGSVTELENTHIPETVDLTVEKVWDDDGNRDGIRPDSLQVTLSNGQSVTLDEGNHWTAGLDNLPVYSRGQRITYTWTEEEITGYSLTGTVTAGTETILTNRHETDKTVATVTKVWDDDGNRDGLRPEQVKMTLSNGMEAILTKDNNWTATIEGLPLNDNGQPITYTWSEEAIPGYVPEAAASGTTTVFTNYHAIALTELEVTKEWQDAENQDGIRPDEITVRLMANGTEAGTLTLRAGSGWTGKLEQLPVNADGAPINYQWTEDDIGGYTLTGNVQKGTSTTLTNTHTPETATLTVEKAWDDNGDQDGIRPETVRATLTANGEEAGSVTLRASEGWRASLEDLPVYAGGVPITYVWTEDDITGYELTGNVTTQKVTQLTNRHIPETKTLTVSKIWDDDNDRDRLRPTILKVTLMANGQIAGTVSLNKANAWSGFLENLPVYAAGQAIIYEWVEEEVPGYTPESRTEGNATTLTNTHVPATVTLTAVKIWDDDENRDGRRPETLLITLHANEGEYLTAELKESDGWSAAWTVPANENGRPIQYYWTEQDVPGYTGNREINGSVTTFTNHHTPAVTTRTVVKSWDDEDDQDGLRPEDLTVYLIADGQPIQTVTLDEGKGWTYTAENLYVYDHGASIVYSWREDPVNGYDRVKQTVNGATTVLTNTHVPAVQDVRITKIWDDAEDHDGFRPDTLTVTLLANGKKVGTVELSEENEWTDAIENLPVCAAGKPIVYAWDEGTVEEYTLTGQVINGASTVLTNTHETQYTVATVTLVWEDDNNRDGVRPGSVTMTLSDGTQVVLTEENHWTATVENLPRYKDGQEIPYTWTQEDINGYTQIGYVTEGTVTTITDFHDIAKTSLTVTKEWVDDSNRDGIRPETLYATLSNGTTVILNEENNWTASVEELPVYAHMGRRIIYSWKEDVPKGYTSANPVTEDGVTKLINTHKPETVDLTIQKIWVGADPSDLPDSVILTLTGGEKTRTVELTGENNWTATISGLNRNQKGRRIAYAWAESPVPGYTQTGIMTEGNTTIITNTRNKVSTLTIYYQFLDGSTAAPTYTDTLAAGTAYDVASPFVEGYIPVIERVKGTMPGEDVVYIVYYIPKTEDAAPAAGTPFGLGGRPANVGDCME